MDDELERDLGLDVGEEDETGGGVTADDWTDEDEREAARREE
jgi:hypothetical protein